MGYQMIQTISIHAPTRGATSLIAPFNAIVLFQSTLPREERLFFPSYAIALIVFQSTLPREERRLLSSSTHLIHNFNPRSHERSDCLLLHPDSRLSISIHAPTRGATNRQISSCQPMKFQSTLPREERPNAMYFP